MKRYWIIALAFVLAACGGGGQKANFSEPTNRLEVVSWWVSPSEHPALEVLLSAFKAQNPDVEVVDGAIAGGGGSNVQVALAARLQAGDPPDVWQTFLGSSLRAWVDAKRITDVSGVYESSGLDRTMPQALLDAATYRVKAWGVPTGSHRGNVLWFNQRMLKDAGVAAPGPGYTTEAFEADLAKVAASGKTALCLGGKDSSGVDITGPLTFRVHTKEPDAYLPFNLSSISVQAKHAVTGRKTEDFNSGVAAIGTGAYRFVSWSPGQPVILTRNDTYWGQKPDWVNVTIRPLSDQASREIALMTGEVDFIESVPPQDAERLTGNPNLKVMRDLPFGVILLQLDQSRDNLPTVFDNDGKPMERNPFKDKRVRLALSKAIDRAAIVRQVVAGAGVPASQMMPDGWVGVSSRLKAEPVDLEGARALLAEAGYRDGFRVTLYGLSDRYAGDAAGTQAIAQMLTKIGVKAEVVTLPSAMFFPKFTRSELPFNVSAWFANDMLLALKSPLGTPNPARGWGAINRGGYSNPGSTRCSAVSRRPSTIHSAPRYWPRPMNSRWRISAPFPSIIQCPSSACARPLRST